METNITDTPRTDAATELYGERPFMTPAVPVEFAEQLERELTEKTNEVERLRELLKKVLFELEKVPFQTPKLTAFTAHRLADRYREELARLAPAPEEPKTSSYSDKCIGNVTKFTHEDTK